MSLSANVLKTLILDKLFRDTEPKFKTTAYNDKFVQAVAEAVVEHIKASAEVTGSCPGGGGSLEGGKVV